MKSRSRRHMRKTKKHKKSARRTRRHYKIGGGLFDFFKGSSQVVPSDCDPMKLTELKTSNDMRNKYQTCCPKKYFGLMKDSSPYCKQLDLNFKGAVEREGMEKQYVGMEPLEVSQMKNAPILSPPAVNQIQPENQVLGGNFIQAVGGTVSQAVGGKTKRRRYRKKM